MRISDENTDLHIINECSECQRKDRFTLIDSVFTVGAIYQYDKDLVENFDHKVEGNALYDNNQGFFNDLYEFLKKNPEIQIEIGYHTDTRGTDEKNLELSQNKANQIRLVLIELGIDEDRIVAKGYGESEPAVPGEKIEYLEKKEKENAHSMNRRIEIKILDTNINDL